MIPSKDRIVLSIENTDAAKAGTVLTVGNLVPSLVRLIPSLDGMAVTLDAAALTDSNVVPS